MKIHFAPITIDQTVKLPSSAKPGFPLSATETDSKAAKHRAFQGLKGIALHRYGATETRPDSNTDAHCAGGGETVKGHSFAALVRLRTVGDESPTHLCW